MVASLQEHLHEYHYIGLTLKKNIIAVITRDRLIDENLKRQILKIVLLCTCRLFLLTKIFQYTRDWLKAFQLLRIFFVQYTQLASYCVDNNNNFSVDQVDLYMNWVNTSLFTILRKFPTLNLPIKSHPSLRQEFFLM